MNFKNLDSIIKFNYKKDLMAEIKFQNYTFVSECVYNEYYNKNKSIRDLANLLDISPQAVTYWMEKWNFKRRPIGGVTGSKRGPYTKR